MKYTVPDRKFPSRWVLLIESDGLGMSMKGDIGTSRRWILRQIRFGLHDGVALFMMFGSRKA